MNALRRGVCGAGKHLDSGLVACYVAGMEPGPRPPVRDGTSGEETSFPASERSELLCYASMRPNPNTVHLRVRTVIFALAKPRLERYWPVDFLLKWTVLDLIRNTSKMSSKEIDQGQTARNSLRTAWRRGVVT